MTDKPKREPLKSEELAGTVNKLLSKIDDEKFGKREPSEGKG